MREFIRSIPIPTAGLALGLVALGALLQPLSEPVRLVLAGLSLFFLVLLAARITLFPAEVREDFDNPIFASVFPTFFMSIMQLAVVVDTLSHPVAFVIWSAAVLGHFALIVWFTASHIRRFDLQKVFPTFFITYVGPIVASVTAPTFDMQLLGQGIFWFGFACYLVLLVVVSLRYVRHEVPEAAKPLFCIYAAPMSLSLAGYLSSCSDCNAVFVIVLAVLAQILLVVVLCQLPKFIRNGFYPSYAAMTFPFVITATALGKALVFLANAGFAVPGFLQVLLVAEEAFALIMVLYVMVRYLLFFARKLMNIRAQNRIMER